MTADAMGAAVAALIGAVFFTCLGVLIHDEFGRPSCSQAKVFEVVTVR